MKKAYSYIRFSSPEQAKGRSYERQWELCLEWCEKNGYELAKNEEYVFFDKGISAYKGQHADIGQLGRFLSLVDDGTIEEGSTLIVESLDRLGREHVKLALPRFMDLLGKGINIVSLIDQRTYTKDYTELELIISIITMSRAHQESNTKAVRIGDAWRDKHKLASIRKTPVGDTAPLWLDFEPKEGVLDSKEAIRQGRYVLNEERVNVVRRIFRMTIDGYGREVIAQTLNKEGIKSFKGKTWGLSSVQKILRNRAVLGYYQPMHMKKPLGEAIADYFPVVIDDETFYQAQEATNARRLHRATKQSKRFQIWQGIGRCYRCGAAMHFVNKGKPPKGGAYLVCSNNRKGICEAKSVRADRSEQVFREILAKVDSLPLVQDSHSKIERELLSLEGKLAERREHYEKLKQAIEERYSKALGEAIYKVEKELDDGLVKAEDLKTLLATSHIVDKAHFFEHLDLESYEGRYRANALLKRLGVNVLIHGGVEPIYVVLGQQLIEYPITDDRGERTGEMFTLGERKAILQIICRKNGIVIVPNAPEQKAMFNAQDIDGKDEKALNAWLETLGLFTHSRE